MGARPEDYERASPEHSYIHVDDFAGPKELAEHLHKLDQDDELYNEYFQWKVILRFCNVMLTFIQSKVSTARSLLYLLQASTVCRSALLH